MPTWPENLPLTPLLRSYTENLPGTILRTAMEAGPAKLRRRFTAGVRNLSFDLQVSGTALQTLEDFFMNDLAMGALGFDVIHPRTGSLVSMRFTQSPQYTARGGNIWIVRLALEVLP